MEATCGPAGAPAGGILLRFYVQIWCIFIDAIVYVYTLKKRSVSSFCRERGMRCSQLCAANWN